MLLEVLLPIGLLIVVAKLAEGVLGRFGLSAIVAYALTGVLLGPVIGVVEPTDELHLFLDIGIFVLFFIIGLDEIDVPGFVATIRGRYFAAAMISVGVSLLVALSVTSDFFDADFVLGLEFEKALALAGVLSLSSLGLVAKVLADGGHLKEPIDDVLKRMVNRSLTVMPVKDPDSGRFLGTVTSEDILGVVVLMKEIQDELRMLGESED